mgnify:FL=1
MEKEEYVDPINQEPNTGWQIHHLHATYKNMAYIKSIEY